MIIRMRFSLLILTAFLFFAQECAQAREKFLIVTSVAADIKSKPNLPSAEGAKDGLLETQVLYNDILAYIGENTEWYYVQVPNQQEFTHAGKWEGYPGWIKKSDAVSIEKPGIYNALISSRTAQVISSPAHGSDKIAELCLGTRLLLASNAGDYYKIVFNNGRIGWVNKRDIFFNNNNNNNNNKRFSNSRIRQNLISTAKLFLGTDYVWGARSLAVDCSGLTSISYRVNNFDIPRDAQEQYMAAEKIAFKDIMPADLIFVSQKDNPGKIVHVMLYIGNESFIEAPGTGYKVRISTFKEKLGKSVYAIIKDNSTVDGKKIYFGRLIKN